MRDSMHLVGAVTAVQGSVVGRAPQMTTEDIGGEQPPGAPLSTPSSLTCACNTAAAWFCQCGPSPTRPEKSLKTKHGPWDGPQLTLTAPTKTTDSPIPTGLTPNADADRSELHTAVCLARRQGRRRWVPAARCRQDRAAR